MTPQEAPMWDSFEEDTAEATDWRSVLDACPEGAGVQLERPDASRALAAAIYARTDDPDIPF